MSPRYDAPHRALQDRFGTRALADRLDQAAVHDFVSEEEREFIESRDMFFLATVDGGGMPSVSYKGGDPGFVRVVDKKTLAFPHYDGNGMFVSTGNIGATANVGLLFLDFETPHRIRVHGRARTDPDDPLLGEIRGAQLVTRVAVSEVFVNCPRYLHRYRKVEASRFVPRGDADPPGADWKRIDVLQDVLPEGERAAPEDTIDIETYEALRKGE